MAGKINDDERTSAVGLFNTGRSYWRSAELLNAANLRVTHPQAPVTFLFCHAIELYLKAYLRGVKTDLARLKKLGHRVADLAKAVADSGLHLDPKQFEILSHIDDADVAIESRYIVTGFKHLPTNEALSSVAEGLDQTVCAALAELGLPVRPEKFQRLDPQDQNLSGKAKPEPRPLLRNPDALQIIVGRDGNYETTKSYHQNSVTRTLFLGVKNIDPDHFISNCELHLDLPEGSTKKTYLLKNDFTLNPGEEKFIAVAYHHQYAKPSERNPPRIIFSVPITGAYYGADQPWLPIGTHLIVLRAKSADAKEREIVCKIWIDDRNRLSLDQV